MYSESHDMLWTAARSRTASGANTCLTYYLRVTEEVLLPLCISAANSGNYSAAASSLSMEIKSRWLLGGGDGGRLDGREEKRESDEGKCREKSSLGVCGYVHLRKNTTHRKHRRMNKMKR